MCGRFVLHSPTADIARMLGIDRPQLGEPRARYNIAPGTAILNVNHRLTRGTFETYRWGLVPRWAKDERLAPINARAEKVASNGVFRSAFRERRSLIPADGFYEWRRTSSGKQPYYIRRADAQPMMFAGLYEHWPAGGPDYWSCAIITTAPNRLMAELHDRMPVILPAAHWDAWLADDTPQADLQAMLGPIDSDVLEAYPVSTAVNRPANDRPELLERVEV